MASPTRSAAHAPAGTWAGDFSFAYLRRLLTAAREAGELRLLGDGAPAADAQRTVFVRHDIDLSLERALAVADVEAQLDVRATYLLMVQSPLYSLEEPTSRELLRRLTSLGHEVGLHMDLGERGSDPRLTLDDVLAALAPARDRLATLLGAPVRSVSFHRPPAALIDVLAEPTDLLGMVNAYASPLMGCYLADSAGAWRHGDPLPVLAAGEVPVVQLLVHPFWWAAEHVAPADRLEDFFATRTAGLAREQADDFDRRLSSVVRRARRRGLERP